MPTNLLNHMLSDSLSDPRFGLFCLPIATCRRRQKYVDVSVLYRLAARESSFPTRMWLFLPLSFLSSSPCASVCMILHWCTCTHARAHASGFACKCAHRCSLLRPDREESIQRCKRSVWNEASWRSNEPRFDTWVFRVCGCGHACAHARLNVCVCVCVCVWSPENQCHRIIMILSNKACRP